MLVAGKKFQFTELKKIKDLLKYDGKIRIQY